jgi:DNA-binding NarL/FixJ family response regulator
MFSGKKILILDDDDVILKGFKKFFQKKAPDNEIITINRFNERIYEIVQTCDAVIFDYYFDHKIKTHEMIRHTRKLNSDIFILCCSGMFVVEHVRGNCIDENTMKTCLNCGANRVMPKDIEEIIDILAVHFELRDSGELSSFT